MSNKHNSPPPWARKRKVEEAEFGPPSPRSRPRPSQRLSYAPSTGNKRPEWSEKAGAVQSPTAPKSASISSSNSFKGSNENELDEAVQELAQWWKDELDDELYAPRVQRIVDLCHCEPPGQRTFDKALIKFRSLGVHQNAIDGLDEAFQILGVSFMLGRVANCIKTPTALATAINQIVTDTERLHGRIIDQTLQDQLARLLDQIRDFAPPEAAPTTVAVASNSPSSSINGNSFTRKPVSFSLPSVDTRMKRPSSEIDAIVPKEKAGNMLSTPSLESSAPASLLDAAFRPPIGPRSLSDPRRGDERSRNDQVYEAMVSLPRSLKNSESYNHRELEIACETGRIDVKTIRPHKGNIWVLTFETQGQLDKYVGRALHVNRHRLEIVRFNRLFQVFVAKTSQHISQDSDIHAEIARTIPSSRFCLQVQRTQHTNHTSTKWVLYFEDPVERLEFGISFRAPGGRVPVRVRFARLLELYARCFICSGSHSTLECHLPDVVKPAREDSERYLTELPQIYT